MYILKLFEVLLRAKVPNFYRWEIKISKYPSLKKILRKSQVFSYKLKSKIKSHHS